VRLNGRAGEMTSTRGDAFVYLLVAVTTMSCGAVHTRSVLQSCVIAVCLSVCLSVCHRRSRDIKRAGQPGKAGQGKSNLRPVVRSPNSVTWYRLVKKWVCSNFRPNDLKFVLQLNRVQG